jgi:hypothetical protein
MLVELGQGDHHPLEEKQQQTLQLVPLLEAQELGKGHT